MTDEQFERAKHKKEQIQLCEILQSRVQKTYANVKRDEIDKFEILDLISDLGNVLNSYIEIKKTEFKYI